jgi:hypothetical protein
MPRRAEDLQSLEICSGAGEAILSLEQRTCNYLYLSLPVLLSAVQYAGQDSSAWLRVEFHEAVDREIAPLRSLGPCGSIFSLRSNARKLTPSVSQDPSST